MALSRIRSSYATADQWLREHALVWWLLLAIVPGGAYAGAEALLNDGSLSRVLTLGVLFGVTFATVTVLLQRLRQG